jgi:hypothetical protein
MEFDPIEEYKHAVRLLAEAISKIDVKLEPDYIKSAFDEALDVFCIETSSYKYPVES